MTLADDRAAFLSERVEAARLRLEGSMERLQHSRSELRAMRLEIHAGRTRRAQLHDSAYARLRARLETMPVIEQAKGVIMAQTGCGAEEAFDMLRRASQRSNVPVRDLAGQVVDRTARDDGAAAQAAPVRRPGRSRPPQPRPIKPGAADSKPGAADSGTPDQLTA